jgi:hypothetical protein
MPSIRSRCATNVPQGLFVRAVSEDHEAHSKPLACANTGLAPPGANDDLRIQNEQGACPSQCAMKCAIWPFSGAFR